MSTATADCAILRGPSPLFFRSTNCCSSSSVDCASGRITRLNLFDQPLGVSSIPTALGNLDDLTFLRLRNVSLSGPIPDELKTLTKLATLDISQNPLVTGEVPTWVGDFTGLTTLYLYENQLTGTIPRSIYSLTALENLALDGNQLTGVISNTISNLVNLKTAFFTGNSLSGFIPRRMSALRGLATLEIADNYIGDVVPDFVYGLERYRISGNCFRRSDINTGRLSNYTSTRTATECIAAFTAAGVFVPPNLETDIFSNTNTNTAPISVTKPSPTSTLKPVTTVKPKSTAPPINITPGEQAVPFGGGAYFVLFAALLGPLTGVAIIAGAGIWFVRYKKGKSL